DAGVSEKIAIGQIGRGRQDAEHGGIEIYSPLNVQAWAWIKKNVVACHDRPGRYRTAADVHHQRGREQNVLVLIEPKKVRALKSVVGNRVWRSKRIRQGWRQLDEHAAGSQSRSARYNSIGDRGGHRP